MELKEAYLDRVLGEVEDLSSRVSDLKGRFAKQKVSVKLEHYWELGSVRTRFTEFKRRVGISRKPRTVNWIDSRNRSKSPGRIVHAMETLRAALP